MDQFADAGADEGEPEDDLAVEVDDHAGLAAVAVGVEAGAGDRGQVDVDGADAVARLLRLRQGEAHRRRLRVGEHHLGDGGVVGGRGVRAPGVGLQQRDPAARAAMAAPAMRAWYLPWWVSRARWLTSPTA